MTYEKAGAKVVEQAIAVLRELGRGDAGRGVRELADRLDISVTTVQRILVSLERTGMVTQETPSGKYSLGPTLLQLSARYLAQTPIFAHIVRHANQIWRETQETVVVLTMIDRARVPIYQVESPHDLRFVTQIGKKYHLHAGASGHAILASLAPELARDVMDQLDYPQMTPQTVASREQLVSRVDVVRRRGYALSLSEHVPGSAGIAVPVGSNNRRGLSLAVFTPESRMGEEQIQEYFELLKPHAELLYSELAHWLAESDGNGIDTFGYAV